jgi:4'-phosphopantetheinyl transferase
MNAQESLESTARARRLERDRLARGSDAGSGGDKRPSCTANRIELRAGELHLWTATDDRYPFPDLDEAGFLLAADEREAADRSRPVRRRQFVCGRVLTRLALSRHCPVRPQEWVFALGPHGKPFILAPENYRGVRFSISHTEGLTACLITTIDMAAVDVERVRTWADLPLIAPMVLSARELSDIESFSGNAWHARFFDYWTLKEAYAKARGMGLGLDLTDIAFELAGQEEVRARFAPAVEDDPGRWTFRRVRLGPHYAAAIAIGRGDKENCTLMHRHAEIVGAGAALALQGGENRCQR